MRQAAAKTGRAAVKKTEEENGGKKKKAVRSTSSRLYNPAKLRQKQEALRKAKEETEMAGCSFRPRTSTGTPPKATNSKQATNRLFEQAKLQAKKREQLRAKRETEEIASCTFSPSIDSKSAQIAKTKPGSEDTFARLSVPVKHEVNENVRTSRHASCSPGTGIVPGCCDIVPGPVVDFPPFFMLHSIGNGRQRFVGVHVHSKADQPAA